MAKPEVRIKKLKNKKVAGQVDRVTEWLIDEQEGLKLK